MRIHAIQAPRCRLNLQDANMTALAWDDLRYVLAIAGAARSRQQRGCLRAAACSAAAAGLRRLGRSSLSATARTIPPPGRADGQRRAGARIAPGWTRWSAIVGRDLQLSGVLRLSTAFGHALPYCPNRWRPHRASTRALRLVSENSELVDMSRRTTDVLPYAWRAKCRSTWWAGNLGA